MIDSFIVQPAGWPKPVGYSNGVAAQGRMVAVAGQIGWNPLTRELETDDFVEQARQAMRNVVTVLAAIGGDPSDVVRLTWFITDREVYLRESRALGDAYRSVFGKHYPAMSVVVVAGLIEARAQVEIEATAVV